MVAAGVIVISTISGLLAYRSGLRHGSAESRSGEAQRGCIDIGQAGAHTGENACVSGRVLRVFTSRSQNTFLDFCPDYRDCAFTSVIFAADRSKFGDLSTLTGRQIEIRGAIVPYQGHAEIVIRDPGQIREAP
jgi:hypothetical protein